MNELVNSLVSSISDQIETLRPCVVLVPQSNPATSPFDALDLLQDQGLALDDPPGHGVLGAGIAGSAHAKGNGLRIVIGPHLLILPEEPNQSFTHGEHSVRSYITPIFSKGQLRKALDLARGNLSPAAWDTDDDVLLDAI